MRQNYSVGRHGLVNPVINLTFLNGQKQQVFFADETLTD